MTEVLGDSWLPGPLRSPVPRPDPSTPRPEGRQIIPVKGEPLGVVSNWPPALQAALARWGATQAKSPALTTLDQTGKPIYTLTYGKPERTNLIVTAVLRLQKKSSSFVHPETQNSKL